MAASATVQGGHACTHPGCTKRFTKKYNLKAHARLHSGATPFACPLAGCAKRFKWRSSLSSHAVWHTRAAAAAAPSSRPVATARRKLIAATTAEPTALPLPPLQPPPPTPPPSTSNLSARASAVRKPRRRRPSELAAAVAVASSTSQSTTQPTATTPPLFSPHPSAVSAAPAPPLSPSARKREASPVLKDTADVGVGVLPGSPVSSADIGSLLDDMFADDMLTTGLGLLDTPSDETDLQQLPLADVPGFEIDCLAIADYAVAGSWPDPVRVVL